MILRDKIIKVLKILDLHDRDLRGICIYCNPNNIHHKTSIGGHPNKTVLNEIKVMEKEGLISHITKTVCGNKYVLYTLN